MKNVAQIRRELGFRTVFNILGPLCNPASANLQVIGVSNRGIVPKISQVLKKLNRKKISCALVVQESGYDELVLQGKAQVSEIFRNKIKEHLLSPQMFKLKKIGTKILSGGDASLNAELLKKVLSPQKKDPLQDIVVANAALTIICEEKVKRGNEVSLSSKKCSLKDAMSKARESILSGNAYKKLEELIVWSNKN
jgi:anthranilate phosphoribosyltransferase